MIIKDAFKTVKRKSLPQRSNEIYGQSYLDGVAAMQVGEGSHVARMDQSGLWLGAAKFADAPFSVDMEGNVIASSATLSAYLSKAGTSQTLTGDVLVGASGVKIDGTNTRIVINDGTTNRGVFGDV